MSTFWVDGNEYYISKDNRNYPVLMRVDGAGIVNQKEILRKFLRAQHWTTLDIGDKTTHQLASEVTKIIGKTPSNKNNYNENQEEKDIPKSNNYFPKGMIEVAIDKLKGKRKAFCSEADFQLEFAWVLKELNPQYTIRLEYVVDSQKCGKMHVDIMMFDEEMNIIPIELKYKTKGCRIDIDGEHYNLANHGAQDCGKYDCLKDIARIEAIRDEYKNFKAGYTVLLTNDPLYKKTNQNDGIAGQFSLAEGQIKKGILDWSSLAGEGSKKGRANPIELQSKYIIHWLPELYSEIKNVKDSANKFYVLINKIEGLGCKTK